jgi:hypothetical protein
MKKLRMNQRSGASAQTKMGILAVERRKHPRFVVELPLDYTRTEASDLLGGIVANASEGGLLVYLPEKVDIGTLLKIQIFYVRDLEFNLVKGIAKVVWCDLAARESWGEHRYGLQFVSIREEEMNKLVLVLKDVGK